MVELKISGRYSIDRSAIVLVMLLTSQLKGTDSEHFALLIDELQANPAATLEQALQTALLTVDELAKSHQGSFCQHACE